MSDVSIYVLLYSV